LSNFDTHVPIYLLVITYLCYTGFPSSAFEPGFVPILMLISNDTLDTSTFIFLQSHGKPSKLIKRLTCENFIYAFYALSFLTSALEMASGLWCIRIIRRIGESIVPNWQGICT